MAEGHEPKPASAAAPSTALPFPVVGIGASAGGLAAFEAFFSSMPADADPGMAFVVVQHLGQDSILAELVSHYTRMEVLDVEDGVVVRPNCTYIIAPNKDMALEGGRLRLLEPSAPRGRRLPIDFFFRSLASGQHERAIGIILSGSASDGALGVRAIKGEGGMVMVQDLDTAEYDGMPRSALATGMVDYELPPAEMPAALLAYVEHAFGKLPREGPGQELEDALGRLFALVRARTGHDFSGYKRSTVKRRLARRMAVQQISSPTAYVDAAHDDPDEVEALFRDLLIGVTSFFRDPDTFEFLGSEALPRLLAARGEAGEIRAWSAGCSTGEEAYSLAILIAEQQEALGTNLRVTVFATDIDRRAIAAARAGIYPASIEADVSQERLARFFIAEKDGDSERPVAYRIHKSIRDMLVFSEQDVIGDPPFSRIDLISCRNLLIYLSGDLQRRLLPLFHYALNPGGLLLLGTSETVGDHSGLFTALDRSLKVYQRKDDARGGRRIALGEFLPRTSRSLAATRGAGKRADAPALALREMTEQALLRDQVTCAALVDGRGDVLYLHGRSGEYLEPTPGEVGASNILAMAREGLQRDLTTALRLAAVRGEAVFRNELRVRTNGDTTAVDLTVRPVAAADGAPDSAATQYLVVLEPSRAADSSAAPVAAGAPPDDDVARRLAEFEHELRAKEEYLQTTTEELETSNEELKSSNEEMQSMNEELQSTNEELETSKEELQSVNEELSTVNAELEAKVSELSQANNDMNNLLAGTGIGTVFVDTRLRILRFTPAVMRVINLIPGDVGRPVAHVVSNLVNYDALVEDARAVLEDLAPRSHDVRTRDGRWFTMAIQPYRTLQNVIEGVVITFVDITAARALQDALDVNDQRIKVALDALPAVVFNQDQDLRYTWIHGAHAGFLGEDALGRTDAELLQDPEQAAALTELKRKVFAEGTRVSGRLDLTAGGRLRIFELSAEPLRDADGTVIGLTGVSVEATKPPSDGSPA